MSARWSEEQLQKHKRRRAGKAAGDVAPESYVDAVLRQQPMPAEAVGPAATPVKAKGKKNAAGLNKLEQAYADELEMKRQRGEIELWKAHPFGLRLANKTFYHPDFLVMLPDGTLEIHETKGFMRDDANVKIKVAASQFPFVFRLIKKKGKTWEITTI